MKRDVVVAAFIAYAVASRGAENLSPVLQLQQRLAANHQILAFDWSRGYLDSLLRELDIPVSSQVLVFSKTSVQRDRISPQTPRAIYFNDNVYVGWVPGGDFIELSDVDASFGAAFYAIPQSPAGPRIIPRADCMQCHQTLNTLNVPGYIVESSVTRADGFALRRIDDYRGGHRTPLEARWGGWYVSGEASGGRHLGVDDLSQVDLPRYLSPNSDIVALMVLEHQTRMHNLITQAHRYVADNASATNRQQLADVAEPLLEYMLFRDEAPLHGVVTGASSFARDYQERGPRDSKGRSLRDLDLTTRLLKYPCSPLIYSPSFDALTEPLKEYLWQRLAQILSGADSRPVYAQMSAQDRRNVFEILRDTKPEFAAWLSRHGLKDSQVAPRARPDLRGVQKSDRLARRPEH